MKNNFSALIKDELVKRFESVVREEIKSHNLAVERSNRQISELKTLFDLFLVEHEKLKNQNAECYSFTQDTFKVEKKDLENAFEEQRRFIKQNNVKVENYLKDLKSRASNFISNTDFEEFKKKTEDFIQSIKKSISDEREMLLEKIYEAYTNNRSYLHESVKKSDEKLDRFQKSLDMFRSELDRYRIDEQGVLRELQTYKKSVFIIEKNIENLYTQIERTRK